MCLGILVAHVHQPGLPYPQSLLNELNHVFHLRRRQRDPDSAHGRIWDWSRTGGGSGQRHRCDAERIASWVWRKAFQSNVPPHLEPRWLGHASLRTTLIYSDTDERRFAERM